MDTRLPVQLYARSVAFRTAIVQTRSEVVIVPAFDLVEVLLLASAKIIFVGLAIDALT